MEYDIDKIIDVACKACGVTREDVFCGKRTEPLPTFRGFVWYTMRKVAGYSNGYIAEITATDGRKYTGAAVGIAINKAVELIYKEKFWRECWNKVTEELNISANTNNKGLITVTFNVPKGEMERIKVEIKEQKLS